MKQIRNISLAGFLILIGFCLSCEDENKYEDLPDAYINIYLQPNSIDYVPPGGWVYVSAQKPSRGIILYRTFNETFRAYERTCTYDPYGCCDNNGNCSVLTVEESGLTIIDTCCNSRFLLTDGTPFDGPASLPLREYQTTFDGINLHIFN